MLPETLSWLAAERQGLLARLLELALHLFDQTQVAPSSVLVASVAFTNMKRLSEGGEAEVRDIRTLLRKEPEPLQGDIDDIFCDVAVEDEEAGGQAVYVCDLCNTMLPLWCHAAHTRFHEGEGALPAS